MVKINKNLLDYFNGEKNVVRDNFILSREKLRHSELVYVSHPDIKNPIYQFWHGIGKKKDKPADKGKAKGTGGKQVYVKLMINELDSSGLSPAASKMLLCMAKCVQWGTGLLVNHRNKKPLTQNDISNICRMSRKTVVNVLKELDDIIIAENGSYHMTHRVMCKGVSKQ